jgi:hypothetical protein
MHESNPNVEAHGDSKGGNLVHNSRNVSLAEHVRLEDSSNSTCTGETSSNAQGRLVVCCLDEHANKLALAIFATGLSIKMERHQGF